MIIQGGGELSKEWQTKNVMITFRIMPPYKKYDGKRFVCGFVIARTKTLFENTSSLLKKAKNKKYL
jgi:hypothetical protein